MKYITVTSNTLNKILNNSKQQKIQASKEFDNEKQKKDYDASYNILKRYARNWKYMTMDEVSEALEKVKKVNPEVHKYLSKIIEDYSGKDYNYTYFKRAMDSIPSSISQGIPNEFRWGLSVALADS